MRNTYTHNVHADAEQRLIFLEGTNQPEAQVPKNESAENVNPQLDQRAIESTNSRDLGAAARKAQEQAGNALKTFEADLQKTEHKDGSTTLGINIKLRIPGAAKIIELFKRFTSRKQEVAQDPVADTQQPETQTTISEAPNAAKPDTDSASESSEGQESLDVKLQRALDLIQKQQEQIDRLTQELAARQSTPQFATAPARTSDTPRNSAPDTAQPSEQSNPPEQRERNLTPREALVQSAQDAMKSNPALASDMSTLYKFFETEQNNMSPTYEELEDTQPRMYYTMADASATINRFAFETSQLDPKIIADGRRTIQNSPQGTFDFIKETMVQKPEDSVESGVDTSSGSVEAVPIQPVSLETIPVVPTTQDAPISQPAPQPPDRMQQEAPAPITAQEGTQTDASGEANEKTLTPTAVDNLKNALGTLAQKVTIDTNGNPTIDLSSVSDNDILQQGVRLVLDALEVKHENGKIAVTKENVAALTAKAVQIGTLIEKVSSGNLADLPPEVSQKILAAIDEKLPPNMRGKLKFDNANIVLDVGTALDTPLAKLALKATKLEVQDGKITIKPQDIAKVVAALTALSRFFAERQTD